MTRADPLATCRTYGSKRRSKRKKALCIGPHDQILLGFDNAAIAGLTAPQFGLGALALLDLLLEAFVCLAQHGGTLTGEGFKLLLHVAQRLLDLPLPGYVHGDGNAADDLAVVVAQRLDTRVELSPLLPVV